MSKGSKDVSPDKKPGPLTKKERKERKRERKEKRKKERKEKNTKI